jgi:type 2 lantibiotic biosynthesis protein LanM
MHQENMIADGDHPVPIDLEMILQAAAEEHKAHAPEEEAFEAATDAIANSVSSVGLLPAYGRSPDNQIFAMGGMTSDRSYTKRGWTDINTDRMRPWKSTEASHEIPNLPHIDGRYAKFGDHIDDFISGFENYTKFLSSQSRDEKRDLFEGFAGLPVRKVLRPTRFYYMLLQRLRDHRTMDDGVVWSAQIDFIARLADWDKDSDLIWPLQRAERAALAALNVPHFVSLTDGHDIRDASGVSIHTAATSGLDLARARLQNLATQDIAWQVEVIRQNTAMASTSARSKSAATDTTRRLSQYYSNVPLRDAFVTEADRIAEELSDRAIRKGTGAAWIGIDWLGDSEVSQLLPLGPDLYNGSAGVAVFLAAHAAVTGCRNSSELALAGIASLRKNLRSRTSARMARFLGLGAATGLGSIVYALTLMSNSLRSEELLADARSAAELFTDDLITADKRLDVVGGSAGGILGLLRLYRDTQSGDVLSRATKCGEHLLSMPRIGPEGRRSWNGEGSGPDVLNGMSHGAAGFAYALAALSAATGREDFGRAAHECIAFENSSFDVKRNNWPDLRNANDPSWPCQWCHGAPGIGLARAATMKRQGLDSKLLAMDVRKALDGVERRWPNDIDTLCCGTLGNIEFFCEAGRALERTDICDLAARRLLAVVQDAKSTGDYRWNIGSRRFNLGLFRGLAGVGYTVLRRVDPELPNVLIWE